MRYETFVQKSFYRRKTKWITSITTSTEEQRFTALDEGKPTGFFTLRNPGDTANELRIGFIILDPEARGCGKGKEMLGLALKYAFEAYGAERVSLGVFENNEPAYHCYKAAGFKDVPLSEPETYRVLGEGWRCKEMAIELKSPGSSRK